MTSTDNDNDDWMHTDGLPRPLFDEHGFPLPLLRIRQQVRARGGRIDGELYDWGLHHPDPNTPDVGVRFQTDGDVLIEVGEGTRIYIDATMAYDPRPSATSGTYVDHMIIGVLDGGYREYVTVDEHGQQVEHGWVLTHPHGEVAGRHRDQQMTDEERERRSPHWRKRWRAYPAWPRSR